MVRTHRRERVRGLLQTKHCSRMSLQAGRFPRDFPVSCIGEYHRFPCSPAQLTPCQPLTAALCTGIEPDLPA